MQLYGWIALLLWAAMRSHRWRCGYVEQCGGLGDEWYDCSRCVHAMLRLARAIHLRIELVLMCGFYRTMGRVAEAPLAVLRAGRATPGS